MMDLPEASKPAILEAIHGGAPRKIEAIRLVREATGCGLKEAKDFVEQLGDELYAKDPQMFAAPPRSGGCGAAAALAFLAAAGAVLALKLLT